MQENAGSNPRGPELFLGGRNPPPGTSQFRLGPPLGKILDTALAVTVVTAGVRFKFFQLGTLSLLILALKENLERKKKKYLALFLVRTKNVTFKANCSGTKER